MKELFLEAILPVMVMFFVIGLVGAIFTATVFYGLAQTEVSECLKWQDQAKQLPGYYITSWQKGQCDFHHITINAEVK